MPRHLLILASVLLALPACRGTRQNEPGADAPTGPSEESADLPGADLPPELANLLPDSLPELLPGQEDAALGTEADGASGFGEEPGGWSRSGQAAILKARKMELPLVVWLANTGLGPLDYLLGTEALLTPAMESRLKNDAVGLRIDYAGETVRRSGYYKAFQSRYKPKGYPTVLVLLPDGTQVTRRTGYVKGTAEGWLQRLDEDLGKARKAWKQRKDELAKSGFRDWTDRQGAKFFAKLLRRDDQEAVLVDPFRRTFHIRLERFSNESLADLLDGLPTAPPQKD